MESVCFMLASSLVEDINLKLQEGEEQKALNKSREKPILITWKSFAAGLCKDPIVLLHYFITTGISSKKINEKR